MKKGTDLRYEDFSEADLTGANFEGANLLWVNFEGANLTGADLTGADLTGANIRYIIGRSKHNELISKQFKWWGVSWQNVLAIGCQQYMIEEWESFDDETISQMDTEALEWWKENKETVLNWAKRLK